MTRVAEILTVEVGSTFTKLAFYSEQQGALVLGGQVAGLTSMSEQDVALGYRRGLAELAARFGVVDFGRRYLSSSAAGGLRMVVCGLTPNLTTKAALESALGAGGVVLKSISGSIAGRHAQQIEQLQPNLLLLCGGLDNGEERAVLENAQALAALRSAAVIVYAGNQAIRDDVRAIIQDSGKTCICSENVYPRVDDFRFREVQTIIRRVFETEVVKAPGIALIQQETAAPIPTPLAVSQAVELLAGVFGDLVVLDVGGATTDVHSYVAPQAAPQQIQATLEPALKRTVEGDLGVFHNLKNLVEPDEADVLTITSPLDQRLDLRKYARRACRSGLERHSGSKVRVHTTSKLVDVVYGRDLSGVRTLIGTGGAIIHGFRDRDDFRQVFDRLPTRHLLPHTIERLLIDRRYVLSSIGLLAQDYPQEAARFVAEEFGQA